MNTLDWNDHPKDWWQTWRPADGEPVCVTGSPDWWYHNVAPGTSSSQLKTIVQRSELHYRWSLSHKDEEEDYKKPSARLLGRVLHAFVFEPQTVDERFIFASNVELTKKAGKEAWAAMETDAQSTDREIVRADYDQFVRMADAIRSHKGWRHVTGPAPLVEAAIFWTDPETGLALKVRPDNLNLAFGTQANIALCADLKSAEDASDTAFRGAVKRYAYDLSAAMYQDGVQTWSQQSGGWCWLVFEKKRPYATRIIFAGPEWLARGRALYREALLRLAESERTDVWPGYDQGRPVVLPFQRYDALQPKAE